MNQELFERLSNELISHSNNILKVRGEHYSKPGDQLSNFRKAATLTGVPVPAAVAGMMAKHTVSIYDMVENVYISKLGKYDDSLWKEKIGDQINYLKLLYASIREAEGNIGPSKKEDDSNEE